MHWLNYAKTFPERDSRPIAFQNTSNKFVRDVISNFNHTSRVNGLLFGQVQSGKTTHTFSVIAATADADPGFRIFVYLTSNSTQLHKQTLGDALQRLNNSFEVCGPEDELRFRRNLTRPVLIILNKDPRVMSKWIEILTSDTRTAEGPVLVIDDEGDAASQNTKVNQGDISTIHGQIKSLRELGTGSVYLQVTATPQALFLQSLASGEKPKFIHYFDPGSQYLGGEFFFGSEDSITHRHIAENDLDGLLESGKPSQGLIQTIASFVCVAAYFQFMNRTNANCLIHPHYSRASHATVATIVESLVQTFLSADMPAWAQEELASAYIDLTRQISGDFELSDFWGEHAKGLSIDCLIINTDNKVSEDEYRSGFNVIVGANAIGRGVAFPHLQTVYYTRKAKTPQADTFWQHSRIFGYDRDWQTLRIFMPPSLFRLFKVLQDQNSRLIEMIKLGDNTLLQVPLPKGVSPTRGGVVDRKRYRFIVGGTNYFPPNPNQDNGRPLDRLFEKFVGNYTGPIELDDVKDAVRLASDQDADWKAASFVKALESTKFDVKATLLLRRERNISANKGSMLSPNDREYGNGITQQVVLTAYRIDGASNGWNMGKEFWLINIKLPGNLFYHEVE